MKSQGWSERLEKQVVKLTTYGSYGQAAKIYAELVGIEIAKTTIWDRAQERGSNLKEARMRQAEESWALPKWEDVIAGQAVEPVKKGVTMDGAMVYILGEEWKEVKIGCVFDYQTQLEYSRKEREEKEVVKAEKQSYVAFLGEPKPFAKLLSVEAERRGYDQAQEHACIGDGAAWIWNLWSHCFPTAQGIVDWLHAVQHIWAAAHLAEKMSPEQMKRWVKRRKDELWLGHAQTVATNILALADDHPAQSKELATQAGYFSRNVRRMQYQEFQEEGYPVGSGTVESACKQMVGARMRGSGMRWSRPGAENMLALRAELLSDRWDDAWQLTLAA